MGEQTMELKNISVGAINMVTFGGSNNSTLKRTRIKAIENNGNKYYQEERIIEGKAFHKNIEQEYIIDYITDALVDEFKNAVIYTKTADFYLRRSKKGKLSVMKRNPTKPNLKIESHNILKNYIIPDGDPVGFLVSLEIMDSKGQVFKKHYSKFRQINRFLELVNDTFDRFKDKEIIEIVDFGCGKGYLTLALYHYFTIIKKKQVNILGIDLKEDVINKLNKIIADLSLKGIVFKAGDINDTDLSNPDIVVALHACDIATDIALAKAVSVNTGLIMAVPCCQHELFTQIKNQDLSPILKYGIMKDKFTELATNGLRGLALEACGYDVDMIEFTTLEHTMKNIMIRATKICESNKEILKEFYNFSEKLNVKASAEKILKAIE